jgi:hypothetical protein
VDSMWSSPYSPECVERAFPEVRDSLQEKGRSRSGSLVALESRGFMLRRRWDRFHAPRNVLNLLGFASALLGALSEGTNDRNNLS